MKAKRFSAEQIIGVLKEADAGAKTKALCRRHGIFGGDVLQLESQVRRDNSRPTQDEERVSLTADSNASWY
jgi:putative transposase